MPVDRGVSERDLNFYSEIPHIGNGGWVTVTD